MVSLAHGDADDSKVEVAVRRREPTINILDTLFMTLAVGAYPPESEVTFEPWFEHQEAQGLRQIPWTTVELAVNGQPETFESLHFGNNWVGLLTFPEIWLSVDSRGVPPSDVALATVTDRQVYIDGLALVADDDPRSG